MEERQGRSPQQHTKLDQNNIIRQQISIPLDILSAE
jgi:hypothetical protein